MHVSHFGPVGTDDVFVTSALRLEGVEATDEQVHVTFAAPDRLLGRDALYISLELAEAQRLIALLGRALEQVEQYRAAGAA